MSSEPAKKRSILEFGAVPDGRTVNTAAIQTAIDGAAEDGVAVSVPAGMFLSGALQLRQGTHLILEEGAILRCSSDPLDFPRCRTRIEGHFEEHFTPGLLNADHCDGLRISGTGILDGNGRAVWDTFWRSLTHDPAFRNLDLDRARLCVIQNSSNVTISGITFRDSQFWNLHLYNCRDVRVEEVSFTVPEEYWKAPSTDGIDVDSCRKVEIRRCRFSITDDCICLKGTKGPFALEDQGSPPVEQILVSDCLFLRGCGAVTCGSEATVVRDVRIENCRLEGIMPLLRLKLRPDTPQRYENIRVRGIRMSGLGELIQMRGWNQYHDPRGLPEPESLVRGISIADVSGAVYSLGEIRANRGSRLEELSLENIEVTARKPLLEIHSPIEGVHFRNVRANGQPVLP